MKFFEFFKAFNNEQILLLQGPLGPFFTRLAKELSKKNTVYKINFTGGDFIYYPKNSHNFKGDLNELKIYLNDFYKKHKINSIILFNDTRAVHEVAINIAKKQGIKIYIFEEGYLRPSYITCELNGVNANSTMSKSKAFYKNQSIYKENANNFKSSFLKMSFYAFFYYFFSIVLAFKFNNKIYHRSLKCVELFYWLRHFYRKAKYKLLEKNIEELAKINSKKYFLAVLQVHNDTQIKKHYKDKSMKKFIIKTIKSFAKSSNKNYKLVFKHHPLDIAYTDYSKLICFYAKKYNVLNRVIYIHKGHLPTLLQNAKGCVCVNSTVGMQALYHNCPLIVLGEAIYKIDGLVYKHSLDSFWQNAHNFKIDYDLYLKFQSYLLKTNQYNANFYVNFKEFYVAHN